MKKETKEKEVFIEKKLYLLILLCCVVFLMLLYEVLYYETKAMLDESILFANSELEALDREVGLAYVRIANERDEELVRIERRIEELQPRLDPTVRAKIARAVLRESAQFGLSPSLVLHLIYRETLPAFNPMSRSKSGAVGLMQIMFDVHKKSISGLEELGKEGLYAIDENVHYGCWILRGYIDKSKSLEEALKRYVGGDHDRYVRDIFRAMAEFEVRRNEK